MNLRFSAFLAPLFFRPGLAFAALSALFLLAPVSRSHAATPHEGVTPAAHAAPSPGFTSSVPPSGKKYELHLYALHIGESLNVVYRIGDTYLPEAEAKLNHFLRDHVTQTQSHYDPKEFDLLHALMAKLHKPGGVIDIVCGYRTPQTNHYLRTRGRHSGVALHSEHMAARAIDIRVPGVSTRRLRNAALSLRDGGVGYYPVSHFVHVDVGPVRHWTFTGHGQS